MIYCALGILVNVVEPPHHDIISLSDNELVHSLMFNVESIELFKSWKFWLCVLWIEFHDFMDLLDCEAFQSMILVKFKIVKLFESSLCFGWKFVDNIQCLVTYFILHANIDWNESVFLTDFFLIHKALENFEELVFRISLQDWNTSNNQMILQFLIKLRPLDFFYLVFLLFANFLGGFFQENFILKILLFSLTGEIDFFVKINHLNYLLIL